MKWISLLILAIMVCGCATQSLSDLKFSRGDATEQTYRRATYECEMEVQQVRPHPNAYRDGGLLRLIAVSDYDKKQREMYIR
jgi:hypothetical protein